MLKTCSIEAIHAPITQHLKNFPYELCECSVLRRFMHQPGHLCNKELIWRTWFALEAICMMIRRNTCLLFCHFFSRPNGWTKLSACTSSPKWVGWGVLNSLFGCTVSSWGYLFCGGVSRNPWVFKCTSVAVSDVEKELLCCITYTRTALETFKLHWPCMHTFVENKMHNSFLCLSVYRSASFLFGLRQSDGCGDASDRIGLSYLLLEDDRETHSDISNYKYNAQSVNLDNYEGNAAVLFFCMLEFLMAVFSLFYFLMHHLLKDTEK